jgi:curved DNA-binding protein CbpA
MAAPDRTHYDVLGIARDADAGAVRSAWKLHVQAWHPDRFSGEMREHAEVQTSRINEAYNTLRDASRRAAYDCRLAADEAASRPDPAPRRAAKVHPMAPRPAATPVGTPMAVAEPMTAGEQASAMVGDALSILRRHPRIVGAALVVWLLIFGSSAVMHLVSGPSIPTSAAAAPAVSRTSIVASQDQAEDLEDLAERARAEAAEADAEMAELMREDQLAAQREAQAQARADALAAKAARSAQKSGAKPSGKRAGRRIVRVMPNAPTI